MIYMYMCIYICIYAKSFAVFVDLFIELCFAISFPLETRCLIKCIRFVFLCALLKVMVMEIKVIQDSEFHNLTLI